MSKNYLSFASIAKLRNNTPLTVSPIGELSNKSLCYTKDPAGFSANPVTETVLYNFLTTDGTKEIAMTQAIAEQEIQISDFLYQEAIKGNVGKDRGTTLNLLQQNFTVNVEITEVGEMITNNVVWLPSYVKGKHIEGKDKNDFTLWFADDYFLRQYPRLSLLIVHPLPVEEMDTVFTLNHQQLDERLTKETKAVLEKRIATATQNTRYPYSDRLVFESEIMDLINTPSFSMGEWTVLGWGNLTDSEDAIIDKIAEELKANSKHTDDELAEKYPNIFNPVEFYAIPYWDRIGIQDKTTGGSTYSPIVDRETSDNNVTKYLVPNMTKDSVIKSMQIFPFHYKSIEVAIVGKPQNRAGFKKASQVYGDYQLIQAGDSDFENMSETTMAFVYGMQELLAAAESTTPYNLPPQGIGVTTRFNQLYVTRRIGKIKFLMMTRYQFQNDGLVAK